MIGLIDDVGAGLLERPLKNAGLVMLSGAISGVEGYRDVFARWEDFVWKAGAREVFNPARLPCGWEYEEYMEMCLFVLKKADVLFQLPGWRGSPGAMREYGEAKRRGICVLEVQAESGVAV